MSDGTKSEYTKTGEKVVCINSNRRNLTYRKVYDVFIDDKGGEFIIDDVGDKRYWLSDDDYYELVDDNETKRKFKVGDKVKVVDVKQISSWTDDVKVGYVGVVIEVNVNVEDTPYKVKLDKCYNGWWFTDKCIELVGDTVDTTNDINDNTKTKPKFKVGDKVKVVDTVYISQAIHNKNGDVGVITYVDSDYVMSPYRVEFDDDYWWFADKCIELVSDDTKPIENESSPIKSDGGSSSYYAQQIPKGMLERFNTTGTIEAKDVIRLFLGNDFNMGNIFKAYCRITSLRQGKGKAGIDEQYDLTKANFFAEDELNYYLENKDV